MSCPNNSVSNLTRNIINVNYPQQDYVVRYDLNMPVTHSAFPYIDTRQVRIRAPDPQQYTVSSIPERDMRYSFGCTNCIRNKNVIFSP